MEQVLHWLKVAPIFLILAIVAVLLFKMLFTGARPITKEKHEKDTVTVITINDPYRCTIDQMYNFICAWDTPVGRAKAVKFFRYKSNLPNSNTDKYKALMYGPYPQSIQNKQWISYVVIHKSDDLSKVYVEAHQEELNSTDINKLKGVELNISDKNSVYNTYTWQGINITGFRNELAARIQAAINNGNR